MNLSANTLFHFTRKKSLLSILKNSHFFPKYCNEKIEYGSIVNYNLIPMVCFCDIPLTSIISHAEKYPKEEENKECYGLGLSKTWGEKNNLTPVLYNHKNSSYHENLKSLSKIFNKGIDEYDFHKHFAYFTCYLKDYECYDEKEWRFVPKLYDNESLLNVGLRQMISNNDNVKCEESHINDLNEKLKQIIKIRI